MQKLNPKILFFLLLSSVILVTATYLLLNLPKLGQSKQSDTTSSSTSETTTSITSTSSNTSSAQTSGLDPNKLYPKKLIVPTEMKKAEFAKDIIFQLPIGFQISLYQSGLNNPRMLNVNSKDTLFFSDSSVGTVYMSRVGSIPNEKVKIIDGLNPINSVYFFENNLYIAEENQISVIKNLKEDGRYSSRDIIIKDLGTDGHSTKSIVIGNDKKLYLSMGSTCNICEEKDKLRAAVTRYDLDGKNAETFATNLRNSVGIDFKKNAKGGYDLWATENGRDEIGDDIPPDEVNVLTKGNNYGWPYCYGDGIANPEYKNKTEFCKTTKFPKYNLQAHSAALGFAFGKTLSGISEDTMLIAYHGSWNRTVPTGYKVVTLDTSDPNAKAKDFLTGFVYSTGAVWGRPAGIAIDSTGDIFVSDDKAGAIYKINKLIQ